MGVPLGHGSNQDPPDAGTLQRTVHTSSHDRCETPSKHPKKPSKRPKKPALQVKGRIDYLPPENDKPSFKKNELHADNVEKARSLFAETNAGKQLAEELTRKGLVLTVHFVSKEDMPKGLVADAGGFCDGPKKGGKIYDIWVVASKTDSVTMGYCVEKHGPFPVPGFERPSCPKCGKPLSLQLEDRIVDKAADDMARTLFHEFLHASFIDERGERGGTGHGEKVEATRHGCHTEYTGDYDPAFKSRLLEFEKELCEVLGKKKQK